MINKDKFAEIDFEWEPTADATGIQVYIKHDKPQEAMIGNTKVDPNSCRTESGLYVESSTVKKEVSADLTGQEEVTVTSVGGCAFASQELKDMYKGVCNEIKVGDKVYISEFTDKLLRNKQGNRTLHGYVKDYQIIGK